MLVTRPLSMPPEIQPDENGNADRAFDALELAAFASEKGHLDQRVELVTAADIQALMRVDAKRARGVLDRVMMGEDPELGLDTLLEAGVLRVVFPEVHAMVGFGDGEWRHKDVWKHTKLVVKQSVPRLEVRWGALLHDIGKPRTRRIEPDGSVTFYVQADPPAARTNWLPAPAGGDFSLFIRAYWPKPEVLDGSWTPPPVLRHRGDDD